MTWERASGPHLVDLYGPDDLRHLLISLPRIQHPEPPYHAALALKQWSLTLPHGALQPLPRVGEVQRTQWPLGDAAV